MTSDIQSKLSEYLSLLDFNDEYYKKDFKGNYKFVKFAISKMEKKKENESEILKFINDAIEIHKDNYFKSDVRNEWGMSQ